MTSPESLTLARQLSLVFGGNARSTNEQVILAGAQIDAWLNERIHDYELRRLPSTPPAPSNSLNEPN